MTHQQLIDFWAEQIRNHESSAQNIPELAHEYKVLANQARLIYMQLVKMDCEEPITVTAIDIPKDSFKGTVFSGFENISSVDLDPEIANIVNDNYSKLLDDLTETHNVEQGDKDKLPDLDFSVSRKIREKYGDVIHELRMNDIRNLEKTLDYFSDHKDASK